MDFYEKKRRAGIQLDAWLKEDKREDFEVFARKTLMAFGFDRSNMLKMLNKNYGLTISEEGEIVKVK